MAGYDGSAGFEFGVAVVGAAAALSGLLFVAMSINIERIVRSPRCRPWRPDHSGSSRCRSWSGCSS